METNKIKNIIFDLGAVIINIDLNKTTQAFADLTAKSFEETQNEINSLKVFYKYEVGQLTNQGFRDMIRGFTGANVSDAQIDYAWNSLLLDIPKQRIDLIKKLSDMYRIFILSNTNHIHFIEVENILKRDANETSFSDFFEKVYLSYEIGMCKPDKEIYEFVLQDADLKPEETLFIDDNFHNVESASRLGIKTIHLQPPSTILDIFNGERIS